MNLRFPRRSGATFSLPSLGAGRRVTGAIAVVSLAVLFGCGPRTPANIVIVTLDTTRADHLETYGYFRSTAPAFDAFAREALVFDRLIVPMATTLPTHLSLFTGTYPLEHGVLANAMHGGARFLPSDQLRTLAQVCAEQGYATAAFISAVPLASGSGAESGFTVFDEPEGPKRRGDETVDRSLAWLGEVGEGPFLLWVHLYDAHFPHSPHPEFEGFYTTDEALRARVAERRMSVVPRGARAKTPPRTLPGAINRYDAAIRFADSQFARLVEALRARPDWNRTAVVVLGDHGEGLGQHEIMAHGSTWEEQLHAPLLMRVPGVAPRRVGTLVSVTDVLPTLFGRMEAPPAETFLRQTSGRDVLAPGAGSGAVLSLDTGRERRPDLPHRRALSTPRWKLFLLENPDGSRTTELYDLDEDPFELRDVAGEHFEVARALSDSLLARVRSYEERGRALRTPAAEGSGPADPVLREQLRALGYLGGDGGGDSSGAPDSLGDAADSPESLDDGDTGRP